MGASALAAVGCIVGATANSVESLIGANDLIGLAASAQLSFSYVVAELVPVRDRFYAMTLIILAAVPFATFGPYISRLFIVHTSHGWRWDYYLSIICSK
jgi:MFS family permease